MNRTLLSVIEFKTPLGKLQELNNFPIYNELEPRVFGCSAYVHQNIGKLEPRVVKCMFIGYAEKKGYRCYDPKTGTVHVTLNVAFHESEPYFGDVSPRQGESIDEAKTLQRRVDIDELIMIDTPGEILIETPSGETLIEEEEEIMQDSTTTTMP